MGVRKLLASTDVLHLGLNSSLNQRQLSKATPERYQPRAPVNRFVSVIIPAHNEEAYLRRTLDALRRQKHARREIIVVANGCTDQTAEIARGRCDRLVVLSQRNLGVARNLGARMARGELLVFLDADTILQRRGLARIAQSFKGEDAAGTVKGKPDSKRVAYRLIYFLKNLIHQHVTQNGSSGVIICWKKDFVRIGGFDEDLEVRENSHLIRRLKRFGNYRYIDRTMAITSMRRFERRGVGRIAWLWVKLWARSLFKDLHAQRYEAVR
jgi:glycosyltransferase involved in cell wall biosynthesis